MSTAKHTPGSWGVYVADRISIAEPTGKVLAVANHGITTAEEEAVCIIGWAPFSPEDEANSRLIAAAPELLDALQLIADTEPVEAVLDPQRAVRVARAAIAKATGETK